MKKTIKYSALFAVISIIISCSTKGIQPEETTNHNTDWTSIRASALIDSQNDGDTPHTKSMVDVYSATAVSANFLKIDEDMTTGDDGKPAGAYTFYSKATGLPTGSVNYPSAYIVNATITSAADNSVNHLRDVLFRPELSYKLRLTQVLGADGQPTYKDGKAVIDTAFFYHSRMIGWSPKTVDVPVTGAAQLSAYNDSYSYENGKTSIVISDLDLGKDVMFTDLREGQHWHDHTWKHKWENEEHYSVPFGYNLANPHYENFFTFKHYRSAVRIFAEAEQSQQNLSMWGQITGVKLSKQPTKCVAVLPDEVGTYPANVVWSEPMDQDIITDGMFGEDPNYADLNIKAEYPISMTGATSTNLVYLGYAMVQPDNDVIIDLHTTSGVYQVTIPHTKEVEQNGETVTENYFEASKYYTIKLSLQTSGAIAEILEFQSSEHYFDLTQLNSMDETDETIQGYRYSNCYIVDPQSKDVKDGLISLNNKLNLTGNQAITAYDGYAFSAIHIGNGDAGVIPTKSANPYFDDAGNPTTTIDPASARLVWESSKGLISNVELIHTYVRFKVDSRVNTDGLKGNAVIAVYDKNNKMLWSWHIWITDTPAPVQIGNYSIMDRNLGATAKMAADIASLDTYGLYYQWGRKDPSVGPPTYNYDISCLNTATYYDYASDDQTSSMIVTESNPTVMTGILNPMYLVLPRVNTDNNWMGATSTYTDLWGYDGTKTNKTIYDPCPYGYRVPDDELVNASASGSNGNFGYKIANNVYLPYAGFKGDDRGSTTSNLAWGSADQPNATIAASFCVIGKMGDYQSSKLNESSGTSQYYRQRLLVSNLTGGFEFWIGSNRNTYTQNSLGHSPTRISDYTNRRTAASVRCVKDESMGGLTGDLTITSKKGYRSIKAGDELTLKYDVSSSGSALSSVTIELQYEVITDVVNGNAITETATHRLYSLDRTSPKVTDKGSIVYTVNDESFLNSIEGNFKFILDATNDAGKSIHIVKELSTHEQTPSTLTITTYSPYTGNNQEVARFGTVVITAESNAPGSDISFSYNTEDFELVAGSEVVNGNTKQITLRAKKSDVNASRITARVAESFDFTSAETSVSLRLITPTITLDKDYLTVRVNTGKLNATTNTDPAYIRFKSADTTLLTVDNNGNITNNGVRNVAVTVTAYINGLENTVNDSCQVVVLRLYNTPTTKTTYWAKASDVKDLKQNQKVIIVKNNAMLTNDFSSPDKAFRISTMIETIQDYSSYTYTVYYKNDNNVILASTSNDKALSISNGNLVLNDNKKSNTTRGWNLIDVGTTFVLQNSGQTSKYLFRDDNNYAHIAEANWWNNTGATCDFTIWYQLDTPSVITVPAGTNNDYAVFSIMQKTDNHQYMYDNNGTVQLSIQGTGVEDKYDYHWVRDTYNGKTYLQNVKTGQYLYTTDSNNSYNHSGSIKTTSAFNTSSNLVIGTDGSIKIGNRYVVAYGSRTGNMMTLWSSADDKYEFAPIADYR